MEKIVHKEVAQPLVRYTGLGLTPHGDWRRSLDPMFISPPLFPQI